jgi:uncharacterized protein (UPF0332 family)
VSEEIKNLIDKSERSIAAAKRLCDAGDYDFAVSRAYYSIFYVCEALLLKKSIRFSRHSALISAVFDHYVKSGELSKEFHKVLHRAFKLRQQGDYLSTSPFTKEVAEELISDVESSIMLATKIL